MPQLLSWDGFYHRLYLRPAILVSFGEWGAAVCDHVWRSVGHRHSDEKRDSLASLLGRVSLASHAPDLPRPIWTGREISRLDELRDAVMIALDEVSGTPWRDRAIDLGLDTPEKLDEVPLMVFVVASVWESEAANLVASLAADRSLLISAPDSRRIQFVLDAGVPASPLNPDLPLYPLPNDLRSKARLACAAANFKYPTACLFLGSKDHNGFAMPQSTRRDVAVGMLRSLLFSRFFHPGTRPVEQNLAAYWESLSLAKNIGGFGTDRTAGFIEFHLNLSNLPGIIAREAMARWGRRANSLLLGALGLLEAQRAAIQKPDGLRLLHQDLLRQWAALGVPPGQAVELQQVDYAAEIEILEHRIADAQNTSAPVPQPTCIQRWFGIQPKPNPAQLAEHRLDCQQKIESARREIQHWETARAQSEIVAKLLDSVQSDAGPFHDTFGDTHYNTSAWDSRTLTLSLLRLPLEADCPPFIQNFLKTMDAALPQLVVEALAKGLVVGVPTMISSIIGNLERLAAQFNESLADHDKRWEALGIEQWILADPQLRRLMVKERLRFTPAWRPLPGHDWKEALAVFSFATDPDTTRRALASLIQEPGGDGFRMDRTYFVPFPAGNRLALLRYGVAREDQRFSDPELREAVVEA